MNRYIVSIGDKSWRIYSSSDRVAVQSAVKHFLSGGRLRAGYRRGFNVDVANEGVVKRMGRYEWTPNHFTKGLERYNLMEERWVLKNESVPAGWEPVTEKKRYLTRRVQE